MLEEQRCNVSEVTVGAAAASHAAPLDEDELIREHRTQIEDLKRQWEEKLRTAEIEASIERAKLAREKVELAERQADLEARLAEAGLNTKPGASESIELKEDPAAGRWLARLRISRRRRRTIKSRNKESYAASRPSSSSGCPISIESPK